MAMNIAVSRATSVPVDFVLDDRHCQPNIEWCDIRFNYAEKSLVGLISGSSYLVRGPHWTWAIRYIFWRFTFFILFHMCEWLQTELGWEYSSLPIYIKTWLTYLKLSVKSALTSVPMLSMPQEIKWRRLDRRLGQSPQHNCWPFMRTSVFWYV